MSEGGVARRLVDLAKVFVGFIRGGLAVVNVLASTLFGCLSGSSVADTASALSAIKLPLKTSDVSVKRKHGNCFAGILSWKAGPMRKSILVKPNLKLIVLGALAIVVLHDVFTRGMSEPSVFLNHEYSVAWMTDSELARLIERVDVSPNSAGYLLISEA